MAASSSESETTSGMSSDVCPELNYDRSATHLEEQQLMVYQDPIYADQPSQEVPDEDSDEEDQGRNFMATRPWMATVLKNPSWWSYNIQQEQMMAPTAHITLDHVFG
eukprot:gene19489-6700_t